MNTPVNFELAKLLKEKGYDLPTAHGYDEKGRYYRDDVTHSVNYNTIPYSDLVSSAPTIAEVVMWLYEKRGIWISVDYDHEIQWYYNIVHMSEEGGNLVDKFNSHTDAYESAFEYTLKNLI